MNKYLNREEIVAIIGEITLEAGFSTMSTDSYNESLIAQKIENTKNKTRLCQAAINMATVGFGNKRYGCFRVNDEIVDIKSLFDECDIKYRNQPGANLKEDDLTPQRLCRFFRYQIREYIHDKKIQTYLFRKYSNKNPNFYDICFRGSEYLDNLSREQVDFLLTTYNNLDTKLGTQIVDRLKRVLTAKGEYLEIVVI